MSEVKRKALILIGYQNDYFAPDGILASFAEESNRNNKFLENTLDLLNRADKHFLLVVNTPIVFSRDYGELVEPVGILKIIKEVGAFQRGSHGAETIPELEQFGELITDVEGKCGFNAFANTGLESLLQKHAIDEVCLAGTITAICIDSTGRSAAERGFGVTILSDCTSSRTSLEQEFYCNEIFPLYARVCRQIDLNEYKKGPAAALESDHG